MINVKLKKKVVLITGGSRGIGKAVAELFMKEGAQVVITSKNQKQLQQTAKEMGNSFFVVGDVRNENDVKNVITKTIKKFGRIDILVNNVGVLPKMKPLDKITEKEWNEIIDVNLNGHFRFTKYVIPQMKKNGGSIINISSIDGLQAKNGLSAYVSSKWAVRGLSKSAAIELGPYNIRVNTVHPGGIYTDMHGAGEGAQPSDEDNAFYVNHPLPRVGLPAEVANMSLFLASDESSFMTGSELVIDGGWTAQ